MFLYCEDREVEEAARAALRDAFPQVSGRWCRAAQGDADDGGNVNSRRRASAGGRGWRGGEGGATPGSSIGRGGEGGEGRGEREEREVEEWKAHGPGCSFH